MNCQGVLRLLGVLLFTVRLADAIPIASFAVGGGSPIIVFSGQSFTVIAPGPANNIIFNFYSDAAATIPSAFGTGYLLDSQYLGTPSALSNATPGFLGQAVAVGGFYTFNPALTLNPATQYFFYTDTAGAVNGGSGYTGGNRYSSGGSATPYISNFSSTNFTVQGTLVAAAGGAPELDPRGTGLAFTAMLCLFGLTTRRKATV